MGRILPRQAYATYGGQFPRSRAAAPIDAIVPWGLVGWWTMDVEDVNFVAGTMVDRSGNGYTGTLNNLAASTGIQGQIGQALTLNGSNSNIDCGAAAGNFTNTNFSVAFWLNPTSDNPSNGTPIFKGQFNTDGYYVQTATSWSSGSLYFKTNQSGASQSSQSAALGAKFGVWNHFVVQKVGTNAVFYCNGMLLANIVSASHTNPTSSAEHFRIGCYAGSSGFYTGGVDDVRIYNRAIDQGEVLQLYAAGLAGMGYWSGLGLLAPAPATSNLAPQRTLVGVGT